MPWSWSYPSSPSHAKPNSMTAAAASPADRREERRRPQPPASSPAAAAAAAAAAAPVVAVGPCAAAAAAVACGGEEGLLADRLTVIVTTRYGMIYWNNNYTRGRASERRSRIARPKSNPLTGRSPTHSRHHCQPRALQPGHHHHPPGPGLLRARPGPPGVPQAHHLRRLPSRRAGGGAQVRV